MKEEYLKGRGAQIQPLNNFIKRAIVETFPEGIDEKQLGDKVERTVFEETSSGVVNKVQSPDLGQMYSMNPYQGCEHGCVYCYARNSHQYWGFSAGIDFETKIIVKKNAPKLLENFILRDNWKVSPIVISGNTDCYQPIEREMLLTRKSLEVLAKYKHPVGLITKNQMILRDIDILEDLASDNLVHVFISINSLDEGLLRVMEPRTASAAKRLEVIEKLSEKGIPTGVMVAPVIPGLNHHEIPSIIEAAAGKGARAAGYTVVRLNGKVSDIFKDWLIKNHPGKYHKIIHHIEDLHGGEVNDSNWFRRMKGEGHISQIIQKLYKVSKNRHLKGKTFPPYNLSLFRKGGNYPLFN